MLSMFPFLLNYWMYVPTFLRFVAGSYFLVFGLKGFKEDRQEKVNLFETVGLRPAKYFVILVCIMEILGSCFLFAGLFVQVVAIIFSVTTITAIAIKIHNNNDLKRDINIYILLLVILISILVLGPGNLSIDLPL